MQSIVSILPLLFSTISNTTTTYAHKITFYENNNRQKPNGSPKKEPSSPTKTPSRAQSAMQRRSRQASYDESGGDGPGRPRSRLGIHVNIKESQHLLYYSLNLLPYKY